MKFLPSKGQENLKNHKCELCGSVFGNVFWLKRHIESLHEGIRFFCDFCSEHFRRKDNLNVHINRVHKEQKKNHKCVFCDKDFGDSGTLEKHIERIHKGMEKHISTESKLWTQKQANVVIKFSTQ